MKRPRFVPYFGIFAAVAFLRAFVKNLLVQPYDCDLFDLGKTGCAAGNHWSAIKLLQIHNN